MQRLWKAISCHDQFAIAVILLKEMLRNMGLNIHPHHAPTAMASGIHPLYAAHGEPRHSQLRRVSTALGEHQESTIRAHHAPREGEEIDVNKKHPPVSIRCRFRLARVADFKEQPVVGKDVYFCPDCGSWTANRPAYRFDVCSAKDRRKGKHDRRTA